MWQSVNITEWGNRMKLTKDKNGRECTLYETYSEISEIAYSPPRYCEQDGTELLYYSFFDRLNRFTLKAGCPKCKNSRAISVKQEKYEEHCLNRWAHMVKKRAGNRCEMADSKCNGGLHAHHIIPKHLDPDKQYCVENGICLCEAHHKMIHSYM